MRPFSTFSKNSTISSLVTLVKSKGILGWKLSHPTPVLALYNLDAFSSSHSFSFGGAPLISSIPHFPRLVIHVLHAFVTLPVLTHSFLFASQRSNSLETSSSFFQNLCSSSPCCGLPAVNTLDHWSHPFADAILQSFFSHPQVSIFQPNIPFSGFLPLFDGATLSSQSAASNS